MSSYQITGFTPTFQEEAVIHIDHGKFTTSRIAGWLTIDGQVDANHRTIIVPGIISADLTVVPFRDVFPDADVQAVGPASAAGDAEARWVASTTLKGDGND